MPASAEAPLDTTAEIETPEQVRFRYQLAGPGRRTVAYGIDLLIRATLVVVLLVPLSFGGAAGQDYGVGALLLVLFLVEWGYYVVFESLWSGRTPGKRALGIRVVREGGYPTGFLDIALRNLLRAADFLPLGYSVGLAVMGLDPRFRRLGDMAAGTVVIVEETGAVGAALTITPAPTADELAGLPARPDLRPGEFEALDLFLRRRNVLGRARATELAELVAPMLARRLGGLRYADPVRFLALLHLRASGRDGPR